MIFLFSINFLMTTFWFGSDSVISFKLLYYASNCRHTLSNHLFQIFIDTFFHLECYLIISCRFEMSNGFFIFRILQCEEPEQLSTITIETFHIGNLCNLRY